MLIIMPRRHDQASNCCSTSDGSHHHPSHPLHKNSGHKQTSMPSWPVRLAVLGLVVSCSSAMVMTSPSRAARLVNEVRSPFGGEVVVTEDASVVDDSLYPVRTREPAPWTEEFSLDDDMVGDEVVSEVQELQRSTGSEILNEELQRQIEEGKVTPEAFLDAHVRDASQLEKVAMSSIPQQLPRPALTALTRENGSRKKGKKQGLDYARTRVSHKEELDLGRQIQAGVALHKLKTDYEAKHGCEISRQEWTKLAKLDSPKELRRQVLDYRRAKQLLVEANMGLVHAVVDGQYNKGGAYYGIGKEEVVQEGTLGLMRAAELFDPSRGLRFSTYATIWIKGALQNSHMMEPIKLPAREKTKWNKIRKAHDDLAMQGARDPTPQEISDRLGMPVEQVIATKRKMTQAKQFLSLDYEYSLQSRSGDKGGAATLNDKAFMADVDMAEQAQLRADVVAALAQNLDAREARLMRLRYGLSDGVTRSIAECAEAMGLSKARVQQLAKGCLKKLRQAHNASSLQEYLLTIA